MINEESTIFPKQIKIDDYEPSTEDNIIRIMETSNLLLGNGGRATNSVFKIFIVVGHHGQKFTHAS